MKPLDKERIHLFAEAYDSKNIDSLLQEIERADLWSLAERPFDLQGILAKWEQDNVLGNRLELIRHNIDKQLRDEHNSDRTQRQPLNLALAKEGAQRLAAAIILSGQVGLNVPGSTAIKPGIEAEIVLADWSPLDVRALLERGIFNDVIYGAVRFRHRDVRELLAAEWFDKLLKQGNSRYAIESLFLREHYGESIISRRLRPVLSWLIVFDSDIHHKALKIRPEIAVEGGELSLLPISERREILANIIRRIVLEYDDRSARHNGAIARIAKQDLSSDTLVHIKDYYSNDDAIFFLSRLVWLGNMVSCVTPFIDIAADHARGIHARRASIRAVMTCGKEEQISNLWNALDTCEALMPRELFADLINESQPNSQSIKCILLLIDKLQPYERYESSGLIQSLHDFINRLPTEHNSNNIPLMVNDLYLYLEQPPYIKRKDCRVSKQYAWLLSVAIRGIERLVETRNHIVLEHNFLSTMLMFPALRAWRINADHKYENDLHELIPSWPELNDDLYWASFEQVRKNTSNASVIDDWPVSWLGHFWHFDIESLPRLLEYIRFCKSTDDQQVALSTAYRVYIQNDKSESILISLQEAIAGNSLLLDQLDGLLNPLISEKTLEYQEEHAAWQRQWDEEDKKEQLERDNWIKEICFNPDRVRNPPNTKLGECTEDHIFLLREAEGGERNWSEGANWKALIPNFGEGVAEAYRDAAVGIWRNYFPILKSERVEKDNLIPSALIFSLVGLEIESYEVEGFPQNLTEQEAHHATRYIAKELNEFPSWFESLYRQSPELVKKAVLKELIWELENTPPDESMHYILDNVANLAPWLHSAITPDILEWVENNFSRVHSNRDSCLNILINGEASSCRLAVLARKAIEKTEDLDEIAWWYSLLVDCTPSKGIPEFTKWLAELDESSVSHVAQTFISALMGSRHRGRNCSGIVNLAT